MQPQPQPIDHIADMSAEDLRTHLRTHLRNAYGTTRALSREIEMLHGIIRRQKEQRDALLAACVSVRNWSKTYEDHIIVDDQLPDKPQKVLGLYRNQDKFWRYTITIYFSEIGSWSNQVDIRYWMPLPPPPTDA